jgi:ParB family chromosome partitioning protein
MMAKQSRDKPADPHIVEGLWPLAVPIDSVEFDPRNARAHGDKNLQAVKASLKKFRQRRPIVVNRRNNQVEAGNCTLQAARELGWKRIAVVFVDDDPTAQTGYAIADNRTAELATWNDSLQDLLGELQDQDADLFGDLLLDELLQDAEADEESGDGDGSGEPVPVRHQVVVECEDADDQRRLITRLKKEGRRCRRLTL